MEGEKNHRLVGELQGRWSRVRLPRPSSERFSPAHLTLDALLRASHTLPAKSSTNYHLKLHHQLLTAHASLQLLQPLLNPF